MENNPVAPQDYLAAKNLRRRERDLRRQEAAKTVPNAVGRPKTVQRRPGKSKEQSAEPKKMGTGYRLTCEGCSSEKEATHIVSNNRDMYAVCPDCANKIENKRSQSLEATFTPGVKGTNVPASIDIEPLDMPCAGPSCKSTHPETGAPKEMWSTKTKKQVEKANKTEPNSDHPTNYWHPATNIVRIGTEETPACPHCTKLLKKDYKEKVNSAQIDPTIKSLEVTKFQTNRERYQDHLGESLKGIDFEPHTPSEYSKSRGNISEKIGKRTNELIEDWGNERLEGKFPHKPASALWKLPLKGSQEKDSQGYEDTSSDDDSGTKYLVTSGGEALETGGNINTSFAVKSGDFNEIAKPDTKMPATRAEILTSLFHLRAEQEGGLPSIAHRPDPSSVSEQILHQRHKEEVFSRRTPEQREIMLHEAIDDFKNMPEDKMRKQEISREAYGKMRKKIPIAAEALESRYQQIWEENPTSKKRLPGRDENYIPGGYIPNASRNPKYKAPAKTPESRENIKNVNKMLSKYTETGRKAKKFRAFYNPRQFGNIGEKPEN